MKQLETESLFAGIFRILSGGSVAEIREAKKTIAKLWRADCKCFSNSWEFIEKVMRDFDQIEGPTHKAAVISGMSYFYLHLSDEHFKDLKDFTLKNLQHPDGRVREAVRKSADWLNISLCHRADPFVYPSGKKLTEREEREQEIAEKQWIDLAFEVVDLIGRYEDDENEKYVYVDEMKPSVEKSLQMFYRRLVDTPLFSEVLKKREEAETREFVGKRQEIKKRLLVLIKKTEANISLEEIENIIYEEEGSKSFGEILERFGTKKGEFCLEEIMRAIQDAWNYFPHRSIGGISPMEHSLIDRREYLLDEEIC